MPEKKKSTSKNKKNDNNEIPEEDKKIFDKKNNKDVFRYIELVDIVKTSKNKEKVDEAFNEIVNMMKSRLKKISYKFFIPGYGPNDVYQEALYALRFKAIKDYDKDKSNIANLSPFDKFAMLCIRRHLSTKLKAGYQNKSKTLNISSSIDQASYSDGGDDLYLSNILTDETEDDVLTSFGDQEGQKRLFFDLIKELSDLERRVFLLYAQKFSYEEIAEKINEVSGEDEKQINIKSVDNALSRIKNKGKAIESEYKKKFNK